MLHHRRCSDTQCSLWHRSISLQYRSSSLRYRSIPIRRRVKGSSLAVSVGHLYRAMGGRRLLEPSTSWAIPRTWGHTLLRIRSRERLVLCHVWRMALLRSGIVVRCTHRGVLHWIRRRSLRLGEPAQQIQPSWRGTAMVHLEVHHGHRGCDIKLFLNMSKGMESQLPGILRSRGFV